MPRQSVASRLGDTSHIPHSRSGRRHLRKWKSAFRRASCGNVAARHWLLQHRKELPPSRGSQQRPFESKWRVPLPAATALRESTPTVPKAPSRDRPERRGAGGSDSRPDDAPAGVEHADPLWELELLSRVRTVLRREEGQLLRRRRAVDPLVRGLCR